MRKLGYTFCEQLEREIVSGGGTCPLMVINFSFDCGLRSFPIVCDLWLVGWKKGDEIRQTMRIGLFF